MGRWIQCCTRWRSLINETLSSLLRPEIVWLMVGCGFTFMGYGGDHKDRPRVIISTDIGGTDPDDFQSMVHLLVYSDVLNIEGLISSPYGDGRKEDILRVIQHYEDDFPKLKTHSSQYPTPQYLRSITKQGEQRRAPYVGYREPTEGSNWIIHCARKKDNRPLYLLVWGGLEDLAQALHDAPEIANQLRVYWIGGPNKKWSPDAYHYLVTHFKKLWIIETNSSYRGWFTGGFQDGQYNNKSFVANHINGHGRLGHFFAAQLGGSIKMGDTPSVAWLTHGDPINPEKEGWGGHFVRAWKRPYSMFHTMPTKDSEMEVFGILEISIPIQNSSKDHVKAWLEVENQSLPGHKKGNSIKFRFSPKASKKYSFHLHSNVPELNGISGSIKAIHPNRQTTRRVPSEYPNWWTDNPSQEFWTGQHMGAQTVSRWRKEYLDDFAERMDRCLLPKAQE